MHPPACSGMQGVLHQSRRLRDSLCALLCPSAPTGADIVGTACRYRPAHRAGYRPQSGYRFPMGNPNIPPSEPWETNSSTYCEDRENFASRRDLGHSRTPLHSLHFADLHTASAAA